ncbi:MAG: NUDIX hydrolase [Myxococcales bacterium]|nr:NUDIX hydrolase [Myxococcales bacterium]MCB9703333.1 NUDIX hydrolase [Myxococcales bacterium]
MSETPDVEEAILGHGRFLRLIRRGRWELVERVGARGAAALVAVTDDARIILISQPRPALGCEVIELPAGLVGDDEGSEDEDAAVAASRELVEETGYEASHVERLCGGPTSPGLTSEEIVIYRATGLRRVGPGGGLESESITVHEVPLAGAEAWLREREAAGLRIDLKVYAGLYFARTAG